MNIKNVSSSAIALIVTGLFVAGVGTYTHNTGFQFAGALIFSVGVGIAIGVAIGAAIGAARDAKRRRER